MCKQNSRESPQFISFSVKRVFGDQILGLKNYYWSFLFFGCTTHSTLVPWPEPRPGLAVKALSSNHCIPREFPEGLVFSIIYLVVSGLSCGMWDLSLWLEGSLLRHVGCSLEVACEVSCPTTFGILVPWPGILNPHCLHWKVDS